MPRLFQYRSPPRPLDRSSLWQFETSPYRAVPRGPPSSLAQHDAIRVFLTQSLHGHYSASSLLPGSLPLDNASVLSSSWFIPLVTSPFASLPRFSCSIRPPLLGSGHLYAGCRSVRKQVPPELIPRSSDYHGFDIVLTVF